MSNDIPGAGTPGADVPDGRGRTGLHLTGRDLDRNPAVVVRDVELLSSDWYVLRATTYDIQRADGTWQTERRETYDRGDGATILLHDVSRRTVLLTRQFRFPVYVNDHPDGMLLETPAGLIEEEDGESAMRRETLEETGVEVGEVEHLFDVYMSPGSVTEKLLFFAAPYTRGDLSGTRHGVEAEGEHIETVELDFDVALDGIGTTILDAKTVMLLQWAALRGPFAR
ncbi:nudix-type nucleoside diphosphatase, YffH/AdpP family [Nocardioides exalbidus]|uniref:Nudix-type nucleoside diphosphatase, YffH/AdpP family n=1 Tax=Nocardioides exalbidus TaxID=402596 RepID=A0A1H4ZHW8_9ACTN|nr:NUDIX domain-containing protein [Nocardioides exalbidus]SED29846.1 nudix-type nucleoside diphosphatase, YffH/AdpP family [Nocardioides exalbidus]